MCDRKPEFCSSQGGSEIVSYTRKRGLGVKEFASLLLLDRSSTLQHFASLTVKKTNKRVIPPVSNHHNSLPLTSCPFFQYTQNQRLLPQEDQMPPSQIWSPRETAVILYFACLGVSENDIAKLLWRKCVQRRTQSAIRTRLTKLSYDKGLRMRENKTWRPLEVGIYIRSIVDDYHLFNGLISWNEEDENLCKVRLPSLITSEHQADVLLVVIEANDGSDGPWTNR